MAIFPQEKPVRIRSKGRLAFAREQGCILEDAGGCGGGIDAHHITKKGQGKMGSKPDDSRTLGFCRIHHLIYHRWEREKFQLVFKVDLETLIALLNSLYAELLYAEQRLFRPFRAEKPRAVRHSRFTRMDYACEACGATHPAKVIETGIIRVLCVRKNEAVDVQFGRLA